MSEISPFGWWQRFLNLPKDSLAKTLIVAFTVALISAIVVSVTSVALRPLQQANLDRQRQARMEEMIANLPGMGELVREVGGDSLEIALVDINKGTFTSAVDPANYDQRDAAINPDQSVALLPEDDIAGLGRRANYAPVYILRRDDELALILLPVHGVGYQSTLYGFLALEGNLTTVAGLTFYEQGETPGLGSRIEEASWEALWPGTEIADPDGVIRIEVVRGQASEPYQVDGISGATRTGNGVTNLLQFWLGDKGFGPFLAKLKSGGV